MVLHIMFMYKDARMTKFSPNQKKKNSLIKQNKKSTRGLSK